MIGRLADPHQTGNPLVKPVRDRNEKRKGQARRSPGGAPPDTAAVDRLDKAIAVWQPYASRPLSREDAREITQNMLGFFQVLQEWDRRDRGRKAAKAELAPARPGRAATKAIRAQSHTLKRGE